MHPSTTTLTNTGGADYSKPCLHQDATLKQRFRARSSVGLAAMHPAQTAGDRYALPPPSGEPVNSSVAPRTMAIRTRPSRTGSLQRFERAWDSAVPTRNSKLHSV
ncbi:hypothetical protein GCM10027514_41870 [Azotobacter armeniacus]